MIRISKSQAMDLYLLSDNDLLSVPFITKPNYLNSRNNIKLYKKDDIVDLAVNKYGSIESVSDKFEKKKKKRINKITKNNDNKNSKKTKLLNYFENNGFTDYTDILSEYPCYLYIEYNKKKFIKEIDDDIEYNVQDVYRVASDRINKRNQMLKYMHNNKIKYKPENSIINNFINGTYDFKKATDLLAEKVFFESKTIFNTIIIKNDYNNLDNDDINEIKNDCIYYYLISNNCSMNYPEIIKERVNNVIQIIIFIKENINIDLTNNNNNNYYDFIMMIKKRDKLLNEIRCKINIPDDINTRLNNSSNLMYNN
jgi:hypothetical protein